MITTEEVIKQELNELRYVNIAIKTLRVLIKIIDIREFDSF